MDQSPVLLDGPGILYDFHQRNFDSTEHKRKAGQAGFYIGGRFLFNTG
jgi:hypothetical protein